MLSGDNQRTVDAVARQAGIDEARGDLLPQQKIERIRKLLSEYKQVGIDRRWRERRPSDGRRNCRHRYGRRWNRLCH